MKGFHRLYTVSFLILCLLLICLFGTSSCKKKSKRIVFTQNSALWAGRLRVPADANESSEIVRRRKQAIAMLTDGVPDKGAMILYAIVKQGQEQYEPPPSVRNTPVLNIFAVDECNRIGFISYSESNEPNAFGDTIFGLNGYLSLFGSWSSCDSHPVYYWSLYLKGYHDIYGFKLLNNQYEWCSSWEVVEGPQSKIDSLVANRGQIILYDRKYKVLDRFVLRPPDKNDQFKLRLEKEDF